MLTTRRKPSDKWKFPYRIRGNEVYVSIDAAEDGLIRVPGFPVFNAAGNLRLVRGFNEYLPFKEGSVDEIHAGYPRAIPIALKAYSEIKNFLKEKGVRVRRSATLNEIITPLWEMRENKDAANLIDSIVHGRHNLEQLWRVLKKGGKLFLAWDMTKRELAEVKQTARGFGFKLFKTGFTAYSTQKRHPSVAELAEYFRGREEESKEKSSEAELLRMARIYLQVKQRRLVFEKIA